MISSSWLNGGDVVAGAQLEAFDDVFGVVERREEDHRNVLRDGVGLEVLDHFVTVQIGHHDVEQDQIEGAPVQNVEAGLPVMGAGEAYGVQFQIIVQKGTKFRIVIDEENPDA